MLNPGTERVSNLCLKCVKFADMTKFFVWATAAMMLCAAIVQAQPGQGGRPQGQHPQGGRPEFKRPEVLPDSVFAANRTARMVEKYGLSEEQEAQVAALNLEYAPKLQMRMPEMERPEGRMPDFRSMSDSERQQMMAKMQERMIQMQEMQEQRDKCESVVSARGIFLQNILPLGTRGFENGG